MTDTDPAGKERAWAQIDHELDVIEALGFPGYFLIVWDIVQFCQRSDILCQGRGSAANSAVCFALGVTKADAVRLGLLFERFLSPERDGPPDIDLDIESDRREEVIQYVYERYGRQNAAQVANVITYRARSAVRDMAKALGVSTGQQDAWSKQLDPWGGVGRTVADGDHEIPAEVLALAAEVEHFPRHLGIHSGGMVLCDRPVVEVCPVEWGRMENRSVLQWDKDDCAAVGLVKFDLLGLGHALGHPLRDRPDPRAPGLRGRPGHHPSGGRVYDMLCKADSVGVFQVESRAQMATLPRLRPREFYDLVVEVALIRPGPDPGRVGAPLHPAPQRPGAGHVTSTRCWSRRWPRRSASRCSRNSSCRWRSTSPASRPGRPTSFARPWVPSASPERMERLKARLFDGMAEQGITGDVAEQIYEKLAAFANFGFPESHSVSFAYLVYSSAWIKLHEPAAFCAALLNAQPMGFYSPHSLVQDARRHGVESAPPTSTHRRRGHARAVRGQRGRARGPHRHRLGPHHRRRPGRAHRRRPPLHRHGGRRPPQRPHPRPARGSGDRRVLLVLRVRPPRPKPWAPAGSRGFVDARHGRAVTSVHKGGVRRDPDGLWTFDPTGPSPTSTKVGGGSGAGGGRREAIWAAGAVAQSRPDRLAGIVTGAEDPVLPGMDDREAALADLWATGVSPEGHPTRFVRDEARPVGGDDGGRAAGRWPAGRSSSAGW